MCKVSVLESASAARPRERLQSSRIEFAATRYSWESLQSPSHQEAQLRLQLALLHSRRHLIDESSKVRIAGPTLRRQSYSQNAVCTERIRVNCSYRWVMLLIRL